MLVFPEHFILTAALLLLVASLIRGVYVHVWGFTLEGVMAGDPKATDFAWKKNENALNSFSSTAFIVGFLKIAYDWLLMPGRREEVCGDRPR